ncbi:MAG: hypothetical protein M1470_06125 [Bacteroidetes bacterium]|nr:hypothetical protein [Bacteroidota bacterium]MCL5738287.1 hypothetical protein [Bacteroidota bacterium]
MDIHDYILATIPAEIDDQDNFITIANYEGMLAAKDKIAIAQMIYHRFHGRYVKPFLFENEEYRKRYKSGFAMMASACFLIESLESFYHGWEHTRNRGEEAFEKFFNREFAFKGVPPKDFYKNIRCGILHQAETTGGFRILRKGVLFDPENRIVNAEKFLEALEESLRAYRQKLLESEWDDKIWDNLRVKMRYIIEHCRG